MNTIALSKDSPSFVSRTLLTLLILILFGGFTHAQSQWTTSGNNINNTNTGNVGIGTASPNAHLHVSGSGNQAVKIESTTAATEIDFMSYASGGGKWGIGTGWSTPGVGKLFFYDNTAGATRMVIDSSGNVGFGTTAPATLFTSDRVLHLASGTNPHLRITDTSNTVNSFLDAEDTSGNVGTTSNHDFNVFSNNLSRVTVAAGGNVGIGTTTPAYKLDVNGHTRITGNITITGTITSKYQDMAEWVSSSEELPAGTVVVLDQTKSNQVVASTLAYDTRVAGVTSAQPGIALGESGDGKVLVATTGRVRVKVDATRAPIHIGDLLVTSDIPGVAMKSEPVNIGGTPFHRPGTLIGKALDPLEKGSGTILVLLSLQ